MTATRLAIVASLAMLIHLPPEVFAGGGHDHDHHGHAHHEEHAPDEPARGPHGGRLFDDGPFAVELTIFEEGVPPQFRAYLFENGKPIPPEHAAVQVELERFGGKKEMFELTPAGEFLTSSKVVKELHSFDAAVTAVRGSETSSWKFSSHEGRTELSHDAVETARLGVAVAGPRKIGDVIHVYGRILANENRVAHLVPRFPGVVRDIRVTLGDTVQKGDLVAIIESNQSLQSYEVRTQIGGVVVKRHLTLGEFVGDDREILVIADLSEVWADFQLYGDEGVITVGQPITVDLGSELTKVEARITYISPLIDEVTQSKLVRATLPNPSGVLRPGLFVSGTITTAETEVPIAVERAAIQTFRDWEVVFLTDGHTFQAAPVELGRKDSRYVEVLSGLTAGDRYVNENSFIIKADVEKSGATHDH